jgi:hypothetical protein
LSRTQRSSLCVGSEKPIASVADAESPALDDGETCSASAALVSSERGELRVQVQATRIERLAAINADLGCLISSSRVAVYNGDSRSYSDPP